MPKKSPYEDEQYYDDEDDFEDPRKGIRRLKREPDETGKKRWEREDAFDRDHDYDERR
jgi:hypothetical protein